MDLAIAIVFSSKASLSFSLLELAADAGHAHQAYAQEQHGGRFRCGYGVIMRSFKTIIYPWWQGVPIIIRGPKVWR